jgi:DNA-binding LacI/PurR family transcriptional regulator
MATQKNTKPVRHVALAYPVSVPWMALLAMQDYRARAVMDECQRQGLDIPQDIAVQGMEDDPTVCDSCRPTLSNSLV